MESTGSAQTGLPASQETVNWITAAMAGAEGEAKEISRIDRVTDHQE
jgi:hypothetical protein